MQGSVAVFLVAGYETTATTLAYLSYYLALNPEIQAKLQQEIDEHFPNIRVIIIRIFLLFLHRYVLY